MQFKTIWLDVPSWECRVFALKSTQLKNTMYFYVIGWDEEEEVLQALTWQVEETKFREAKFELLGPVLLYLALQDKRYAIANEYLSNRVRVD